MSLLVQKYGGSSVASPDRIRHVAKRIQREVQGGHHLAIVLSAMGDTTDELIALANAVSSKPSARELDMLMSTGEQVSIALLAMALEDLGIKAMSLTGWMSGIMTNSKHRKASIDSIETQRLRQSLLTHDVVIVAGFQGLSPEGNITTLGRGGSDTTAVALAAALGASLCEIYTDVDGVYTTDPRLCPNAVRLEMIDYDEMLEMARLGAGVLHPRSVEIARNYRLPIAVRSTFSDFGGTIVKEVSDLEKVLVRGIALDDDIARLTVTEVPDRPGIAFALFSALAEKSVSVDMIIQNLNHLSKNDISFTIAKDDLKEATEVIKNFCVEVAPEAGISSSTDVAKLSIVGTGMSGHTEVAATLFKCLFDHGVNIEMISTSEVRISCLIANPAAASIVSAVHQAFELDKLMAIEPDPALDPIALKLAWQAES